MTPVSDPNGNFIATSKIAKTTNRHTDCCIVDKDGKQFPYEKATTAFIFMNDNPEAYFNYDDMSIPIKKGSLVVFKGDRPHNTIVRSGTVDLLGPFEGNWLTVVGSSLPSGKSGKSGGNGGNGNGGASECMKGCLDEGKSGQECAEMCTPPPFQRRDLKAEEAESDSGKRRTRNRRRIIKV